MGRWGAFVIVHVWVGGATGRARAEPPCSASGLATLTRATYIACIDSNDSGLKEHGVARLPTGRRKKRLGEAIHELVEEDLDGRVEPFDATAAIHYVDLLSDRETAGRPIGIADTQIAAICRKLGATLATRNTSDFEDTGIELLDPWRL
jgi:predicted nucleic acid-binding protein